MNNEPSGEPTFAPNPDRSGPAPDSSQPLPWLMQELLALDVREAHSAPLRRNWLQGRALDDGPWPAQDFLPRRLRESLPRLQHGLDAIARVRSRHPAADGGERLLMTLADGQSVETVLLPGDAVCVSSQVGCAVGCTFCMTGQDGLLRQLSTDEILAQVVVARRLRPIRRSRRRGGSCSRRCPRIRRLRVGALTAVSTLRVNRACGVPRSLPSRWWWPAPVFLLRARRSPSVARSDRPARRSGLFGPSRRESGNSGEESCACMTSCREAEGRTRP